MGLRRIMLYVYWDKVEKRQFSTTTFPAMQERHSGGRYILRHVWKLKKYKKGGLFD
jgi:hypothetical protein